MARRWSAIAAGVAGGEPPAPVGPAIAAEKRSRAEQKKTDIARRVAQLASARPHTTRRPSVLEASAGVDASADGAQPRLPKVVAAAQQAAKAIAETASRAKAAPRRVARAVVVAEEAEAKETKANAATDPTPASEGARGSGSSREVDYGAGGTLARPLRDPFASAASTLAKRIAKAKAGPGAGSGASVVGATSGLLDTDGDGRITMEEVRRYAALRKKAEASDAAESARREAAAAQKKKKKDKAKEDAAIAAAAAAARAAAAATMLHHVEHRGSRAAGGAPAGAAVAPAVAGAASVPLGGAKAKPAAPTWPVRPPKGGAPPPRAVPASHAVPAPRAAKPADKVGVGPSARASALAEKMSAEKRFRTGRGGNLGASKPAPPRSPGAPASSSAGGRVAVAAPGTETEATAGDRIAADVLKALSAVPAEPADPSAARDGTSSWLLGTVLVVQILVVATAAKMAWANAAPGSDGGAGTTVRAPDEATALAGRAPRKERRHARRKRRGARDKLRRQSPWAQANAFLPNADLRDPVV
jgi:hypothetical protein